MTKSPSQRWDHSIVFAAGAAVFFAGLVLSGWFAFDPPARKLIENTVRLAGATLLLALPSGILLGLLIARTRVRGGSILAAIVAVMLFIPPHVHAAAWQGALGLDGCLTLASNGRFLLRGFWGAACVHAAAALPWTTLFVAIGARLSSQDVEDPALLDGSTWQVLRSVALPMARGGTIVAIAWTQLITTTEIAITDLFQVRTYAEELYTFASLGDTENGKPGPGPGLLLGCGAAGFLILALWMWLRRGQFALSSARLRNYPLAKSNVLLPGLAWGIMLLAVGLPLFSLVWTAGVEVSLGPEGRVRTWQVGKFASIMASAPVEYWPSLKWTILSSLSSATIACFLGLLLAALALRGTIWRVLVGVALVVLMAIPGPMVALGMIEFVNGASASWLHWLYDRSIAPLCGIFLIRCLPWTTLILWTALSSLPREGIDAMLLEGTRGFTLLRHLALPLRYPYFIAAWLVAFMVCSGELSASILVSPPGIETLSVQLFRLLHAGVQDQVASICLMSIVALGCLAGGAALCAKVALSSTAIHRGNYNTDEVR